MRLVPEKKTGWLGYIGDEIPHNYFRLGSGFKYFLCSSLFGEDSHFDYYVSNGLKPPTRWRLCHKPIKGSLPNNQYFMERMFFPTCQVRVVRFYVSHFSSSSSSFSSFSFSSCRPPPRRISTAILWVQCGVLDPNCDHASSVWRAGPQPRSCEFSVACRTPTAIMRVQCGVPDPNRDPANSVWRPGPQPRSCEFSVASRTPTTILWVQCGVPDLKYCVRKFVRKNDRRYVRKNVRRYVRRNVKKICQKICQKECQKICQKDVRKNVRRYVRKNVKRYVRKNGKRYVRKNVRR